MSEPAQAGKRRVGFGPYEADLAAGELRKNGRSIHLQEQPFQVLAALLERPGEVVTRDQLRERLWAGDTFVDFDQGLNTAINKLREALGDSVANPRFVETLPKRGYRFLFPIDSEPAVSAKERPQSPGTAQAAGKRILPSRFILGVVGALLLILAALALFSRREPVAQLDLPLRRFAMHPPSPLNVALFSSVVAISPNARHIAFIAGDAESKLWVQDLYQAEPRAIEGTEGASGPFWSPDSRFIGFAAGWSLKKVPVDGGVPTPLCDLPGRRYFGGAWALDGESIVISTGVHPTGLYEVPAAGGPPKLLLSAQLLLSSLPAGLGNKQDIFLRCLYNPHFLPSRRSDKVLAFAFGPGDARIVVHNFRTGRSTVLETGEAPAYSPSGHIVYRSGKQSSDLWAQPFSLETLEAAGPAFRIAHNGTDPSIAADGTLVYQDAFFDQLVWRNRKGEKVGQVGEPAQGIFYPAISPNERLVAVEAMENLNLDVWIHDVARGSRTRLSVDPDVEILPVWSPDSSQVAFGSYRAGNTDIFVRVADASGEELVLANDVQPERVSDWSRDGQYILYSVADSNDGHDLWYMKRSKDGWERQPLLQTSFSERTPKLSPDGRYVAYLSDESGRDEVYVRRFPKGDGKWAVSTNGASQLRWRRDGRELFFGERGTLMAVPVRTEPEFFVGTPVRLFAHTALTLLWIDANYDVPADGERVLLPEPAGRERVIHVVQNWFAEFRDQQQ